MVKNRPCLPTGLPFKKNLNINIIGLPKRIKKSNHLLILKKSKQQSVLINTIKSRPLLINRGFDYIEKICNKIDNIRDIKQVLNSYPEEKKLIEFLFFHNILIDDLDEDKVSIPSDTSNKKNCSGMSLYLLLSQSCNMGCIYCLNGKKTYRKDERPMMDEKVAFRAIDVCLNRLSPGGNLQIVFFGGEPLLNWELVTSTISKCEDHFKGKYKNRTFTYHITTNLTILPEDLIEWAKRHSISFLVDIDGPPQIHNKLRPFINSKPSHSIITKNINKLIDNGIKVEFRATITSHNVDSMNDISKHHFNLGGKGTALVALSPVNSDELTLPESWYPDPEKYIRGLRKVFENGLFPIDNIFPLNEYTKKIDSLSAQCIACGAPYGNTPTVSTNGDVYPCIYWVGIEKLKMFNVFDQQPLFNNKITMNLRDKLHVDNLNKCKKCKLRYLCGGGCPVYQISIMENPKSSISAKRYAEKIKCKISKEAIDIVVWERAKKAGRDCDIKWT